MCNCKKPATTYNGKWVKFQNEWYKVYTEDRIRGMIGFIREGKLEWVRPSRIEGTSDSQP